MTIINSKLVLKVLPVLAVTALLAACDSNRINTEFQASYNDTPNASEPALTQDANINAIG